MLQILQMLAAILISLTSLVSQINAPATTHPTLVPQEPKFGAAVVQAQAFTLAGSGVTATASTVTLKSFTLPDASTTIQITDFQGSVGYATIEPGTSREEQISFSGVTQNANGTAILTGVTRGLDFRGANCSAVTANKMAHAGGTILILSNTACYYGNFPSKTENANILGQWSFASTSLPRASTGTTVAQVGASTSTFATVAYVNSVASSGASAATTTIGGLVILATPTQTANGVATGSSGGTDYALVPYNSSFSSSSVTSTTFQIPVAVSGTLSTGFINQSASATYSFLGPVTFASTTFATGTTFNGNVTFNASTTGLQAGGKVLARSNAIVDTRGTTAAQTIVNATIPTSTLGTNTGGIQLSLYFNNYSMQSNSSNTFRVVLGGVNIATATVTNSTGYAGAFGHATFNLFPNNSTTAEYGFFSVAGSHGVSPFYFEVNTNASSSASTTVSQPFTVTEQNSVNDANQGLTTIGYVISTLY